MATKKKAPMKRSKLKKMLGGFRRVNPNWGSSNQYGVMFDHGDVFQSYDSIICVVVGGKTYLGPQWDCSKTTNKHRFQFMGEVSAAEVRKGLESGEYVMIDFNQ